MADLMHEWGYKQGLSEDDIIWAVKQHMQHADGTMRFGISSDRRGQAVIKVLPRRVAESTPRSVHHSGSRGIREQRRTPERETLSSAHTTADKLGMSLEDLIPCKRRSEKSANSWEASSKRQDWHSSREHSSAWDKNREEPGSGNSRGGSWEHSSAWDKNREEPGSGNSRGGSWEHSSAWDKKREEPSSWKSRGGSGSGWSAKGSQDEQIHRWIGWALKTGYRDLGLHLVGDDALHLEDLAAAIRREQSNFGFFDAKGLKRFLRDTDQEGRFDVDSKGLVRKIPRGERSGWGWNGRDDKWRSW